MLSAMMALGVVIASAALGSVSPGAGDVSCPPTVLDCEIEVERASRGGDPPVRQPAGGEKVCVTSLGTVVPCWTQLWGTFNSADSCYYRPVEPPPPGTDPVWQGNYPDGRVYLGHVSYIRDQVMQAAKTMAAR